MNYDVARINRDYNSALRGNITRLTQQQDIRVASHSRQSSVVLTHIYTAL